MWACDGRGTGAAQPSAATIPAIMLISPIFLDPNGPVCMDDRIRLAEIRAGLYPPPAARDPFASRNAVHDIHVVPHAGSWAVKVEREPSYKAVMPTQTEALGLAITQARAAGVQLVLHGRDGRFREVFDYTH